MSDDEDSMKGKTYLEILAENDAKAREEFNENAKDLLVDQNRYEANVEAQDKLPDELEDQQLFQQVQPSRQIVEIPKITPYNTSNTTGIRYNKDVQTRVINIDSRFRPFPTDSETNFLYKLNTPVKNVISVKTTSIEIPNTYYNFSRVKANVYLTIEFPVGNFDNTNFFDITIPDGNYVAELAYDFKNAPTTSSPNSSNIIDVINASLIAAKARSGTTILGTVENYPQCLFNPVTGLVSFYNIVGDASTFNLYFNQIIDPAFQIDEIVNRFADWGLGYNLGFRQKVYTDKDIQSVSSPTILSSGTAVGIVGYNSERIVDVFGPNYLFLSLNPDWKVVQHNDSGTINISAFSKIVVNVPKNRTIYDNGSNTITKEFYPSQPITVSSFQVNLVDLYGEEVDLVGANISITLELIEAMNPALYNHIREV